jgi:catalase
VIPSASGAELLSSLGPAKDFVSDAHAHCKFVGYNTAAGALFDAAGLTASMDEGYIALDSKKTTVTNFFKSCRQLRYWNRESAMTTP